LIELAHQVAADALGPGTSVTAVEPVQAGLPSVLQLLVDRAPYRLVLKVAKESAAPAVDLQRSATALAMARLLWCLEYDADTPRHRADTAGVYRRLGVRA